MIIDELLEGLSIDDKRGSLTAQIRGIAYDSRAVDAGFLFVAINGHTADGNDYIKDAVNRGAAAVLTEKAIDDRHITSSGGLFNDITFIKVPDSRKALASISARYYGWPSRRLSLIGITGTNGKTTTSYITRSILEADGRRTGLIGTIQYITGKTREAQRTTPESSDLQGYLSEMADNGMEDAVIEVSSHALLLHRVEGCAFRVAAFTNFSQDHLDFHGSMSDYLEAKERIFSYLRKDGVAVLNWDDPAVRELGERDSHNVITCGLLEGAMIRAEKIDDTEGLSFDIQTPVSRFRVESQFAGRFNVYNILISAGIAYALGIGEEAIQQGIRETRPVKGRFEKVDEGQDFLCIVDYAHTEDALRTLINEARMITGGRVITLFGCGGDRDRTKRALMGTVASELSDIVIVTSDNPRNEDPLQIIEDILKGISKENYITEPDRAAAVRDAVSMAKEGDTFLIAGKGHEEYQEIGGVKHPFSDNEIVRKAIKEIN
jgi:UDP-N-acetylmuramoyl-L-alanyl-D-glutamate--2,6-diaminopimelate ligase